MTTAADTPVAPPTGPGTPAPEGRLGRIPALDGVRALAVIAVVLYHDSVGRATDRWVPGGFLGVDVFFVLSGFLITGILLTNRERTGRTVTREFWIRRARRLLPALLVMLLLCAAWGWFAAPRWELASLRHQSFATLFYVQNWYRMFGHPGRAPLSHTWSLSIEEQWYFVWPFLLGGLLIVARTRRARLAILVAAAIGSALLMVWYFGAFGWGRAYGSTTSRAGELVIGGILAFLAVGGRAVVPTRVRPWLTAAAVLATAVLLVEFATLEATDAIAYRGGCYLAAIATAVIILAALQPGTSLVHRTFGWRPFAAIGLASYGLYLFHVPLFRWMSPEAIDLAPLPLLALRLAVLAALAVGSYLLVEMPVRRGRLAGHEGVAAVVATVCVIGAILLVTRGATAQPGWVFARDEIAAASTALPSGTTRVLVAGELDAYDLSASTKLLINRGVPGAASASVATIGCTLVGNRAVVDGAPQRAVACDDWRDTFAAGRDALDPDLTVLMAGQGEILDQRAGGRTLRVGTATYERVLTERLDAARRILTERGSKLLLTSVPCVAVPADDDSPTATALRDPVRHAWVADVWRRYARAHAPTVTFVDIDPILCPTGDAFPVGVAGAVRTPDGRLTPIGATALWNHLVRVAVAAHGSAPA